MKTKKIKKLKSYVSGGIALTLEQQQRMGKKLQLGQFNQTSAYQQMAQPLTQPQLLIAPAAAPSGNGMIGKVGGAIGGIASGASDLVGLASGPSTATTKGEAVSQSVQGVFKGAGTGAKMGSAFGPVGAIVGGVAGAAVGLVGKSGNVESESFYEDPTMTLGTGIKGAIGNKKLKKEFEHQKNRVKGNRFAKQDIEQFNQEWAEDYDTDVNTLAYGGEVPSSIAYVDDGELIKTPDGEIQQVPEEGKPTDSNLVTLPEGTRILSDKLKVPGTKETYAQMGNRLMSKKKTKGKDRFAQNSAKLNQMNDEMIHEKLFSIQEFSKVNTGGQKKKGIPRAAKGMQTGPVYDPFAKVDPNSQLAINSDFSKYGINQLQKNNIGYNTYGKMADKAGKANVGTVAPVMPKNASRKGSASAWIDTLGNIGEGLGTIAPILSNMNAKAEQFQTIENPYASTIMSTMGKRKHNIEPALRGVRENRAAANYNAEQLSSNTGANMAFRLQSAINQDKAIADIYVQKSNIENQYKGDYANTLNNLGQQYVGSRNLAVDWNARSRGAARNAQRTAMTELSNYIQNNKLMRNQKGRDSAMLDLYKPFLEQGYSAKDIAEALRKFKKQ